MNSRKTRLKYIRYKNKMSKKYPSPKWVLENRKPPFKWKNTNPTIFEESWIIDIVW